jgi:hypothetical protein
LSSEVISTALVDQLHDPAALEHGGDDAGSQFVEPGIDRIALLDRRVTAGLQERHVGADPARVDTRIEQKLVALLRRQGPQARAVVGGARHRDVGLAAFQ